MNHKNLFFCMFFTLLLSCMQPVSTMLMPKQRAQETNTILILACEKGNLGLVKHLVEKGASVNSKDALGVTLLHYACKNRDHALVKYLIENGANINAEGYCKWTPLHNVCQLGFYDIAEYLIEKGANIFARDSENLPPLYATCLGSTPNLLIIQLLIEKGADINAKCFNDNTILHAACEKGFYKCIESLIKHGAYVNAENNVKATPLHIACVSENPDPLIIKLLIDKRAQVNAEGLGKVTPLHIACKKGFHKGIESLIEHGAHVNAQDDAKTTPLHNTCKEGYYEGVKYLVEHGACVNAQDNTGETPLYMACRKGFYKIIEYLIKQDAQVNSNGYAKSTPLSFAAYNGHLAIVKLLIQNKAPIHCSADIFPTPLHAASASGQIHIVQYLLNSFPELNVVTTAYQDLSALDYAYMFKQENIIQLFAKRGARIVSEEEAEKNMRALFKELDQEALQKQVKREQRKHNKKLKNQTIKNTTDQRNHKTNKKIEPIVTNNIPCMVSDIPMEPTILTTNSTETALPSTINNSPAACSLISCSDNFITPKNSIIITQKKQHYTAQTTHKKSIQLDQVHTTYQIGHDKKLKWPRYLNEAQYNLMREHLRKLKHWPETPTLDIKPLKGQPGILRLRVGGYRVLFTVNETECRIIIHEIGLRKKVYRGL